MSYPKPRVYTNAGYGRYDPNDFVSYTLAWARKTLLHVGVFAGNHGYREPVEDQWNIVFTYSVSSNVCLNLHVSLRDKKKTFQFDLIGRNDYFIHWDFSSIEQVIIAMFPSLNLNKCHSMRPCQMFDCKSKQGPRDHVTYFAGMWVCEPCREKYTLTDSTYTPSSEVQTGESKSHKSERAKMTGTLRFEILTRDNFRCRACGRDPRKDEVKLHVDHIVPIAKGGKTETGNLHVLCSECNQAKSANRIEQMELWPTEDPPPTELVQFSDH